MNLNNIYDKVLYEMKLVEENAEELDKHFIGLDLVFLKNSLDFIRAEKKKAHLMFAPFLVNAFEK